MSLYLLATGTLFRDPEQRTSKAGKLFWTGTVKTKDGDATQWVKVCVFSESIGAELMRLKDGDALSAQGAFRVETYDKDGATRVSLSMIADSILPLRAAQKPRKPKSFRPASPVALERRAADRGFKNRCAAASPGLDDSIPF